MQFIDLKAQYKRIQGRVNTRINAVLDNGSYIMGAEVKELEQQLSNFVGGVNTISCANGTDALQLALMALGIGMGDAVLVPSFTFFASAEAISLLGAEPVFVDVEEETFNLNVNSLKQATDS